MSAEKLNPDLNENSEKELENIREEIYKEALNKVGYDINKTGTQYKLTKKWDIDRRKMDTDVILDIKINKLSTCLELAQLIEGKIQKFKSKLSPYIKENFLDKMEAKVELQTIYNDSGIIDSKLIGPEDVAKIFGFTKKNKKGEIVSKVYENEEKINKIIYELLDFIKKIKITEVKKEITKNTRLRLEKLKNEIMS